MAKATTKNGRTPRGTRASARKKNQNLGERFEAWWIKVKGDKLRSIAGILIFAVALYLFIIFSSFFFTSATDQVHLESIAAGSDARDNEVANAGGLGGARVAQYLMHEGFGVTAYFIPFFLLAVSLKLLGAYRLRLWKWFVHCALIMVLGSVGFSLLEAMVLPDAWIASLAFSLGGSHGNNICSYLFFEIGTAGTAVLVTACFLCYLTWVTERTVVLIRKMLNPIAAYKDRHKTTEEERPEATPKDDEDPYEEDYTEGTEGNEEPYIPENDEEEEIHSIEIPLDPKPTTTKEKDKEKTARDDEEVALVIEKTIEEEKAPKGSAAAPYNPKLDLENYHYPTLDLLQQYEKPDKTTDMAEQQANKDRIIRALRNFGVEITSIRATIGPAVTLYEITPADGVKINKIRNLEDDIALSLAALGIRIIAPIPGKGTIGIEVPNKNPQIVSMRSIIESRKFQESSYELPIAMGKTITNEVFMVDLAKMPHLLVAGATGQGKSVGLNAIITSLLYKKHPAELKLVLVDPKKVELSVYSPIAQHFLAKLPENDDAIITDVSKVVQTLKSLCQLMDTRYDLLKKARVRNIKEYNTKFKERCLLPDAGHAYMPYIVVVIDEFGDLIMTAGKEVELPIARIAQLARAVGIHMIIATQRPTTNIITGTIKANFPARIAFKVSSQIDSRTILDRNGANQLVGKGDMLFLLGNEPVRVQCAFVDTPEVDNIASYIAQQQGYPEVFPLPEVIAEGNESENKADSFDGKFDPLFAEAARLIVISQSGSTSLIQRKFTVGFNRAGRLMDQLEKAGIVGPSKGSKPRDVLFATEQDLEARLNSLNL